MPGVSLIEKLEDRRLLSVSVSVVAGPLAAGDTFSYGGVLNGKTLVAAVDKVVGAATFNGVKAIDVSITDYNATGKVTDTAQRYEAASLSNGLLFLGKTTDDKVGTNDFTSIHTFSPAELLAPASIVVGKVYTSTCKETTISKTNGKAGSTTTSTHVLSVELLSASTQVITTPAGKFNCYECTSTDKVTTNGTTTTTTDKLWFAPGVGEVKVTEGTATIELVSYKL